MKANYTYQATGKPRAAKQSANVAISALSVDTSSNQNVVKLNIEEEQSLFISTTSKLVLLCQKTGMGKVGQYRGQLQLLS
jgi:hypothetical protein